MNHARNHSTKLAVILALVVGATVGAAHARAATTAALVYDAHHPTALFAAEELQRFLGSTTDLRFGGTDGADWRFVLREDTDLAPYAFAYDCLRRDGANVVTFRGPDLTCVLHAVYTFLEDAGVRFEMTGPVVPEKIDLDTLVGRQRTVAPSVARRGIRFHMNFPQDLSSFSIPEAREYIRNMARLRMNFAVFHSYPGRLHTGVYKDITEYAGKSYAESMEIPDDPVFRRVIRNRRLFRAPELEAYDDMPRARAIETKEWMGAIFEEVKRVGMYLQFSLEPRLESVENTAAMFMDAVTAYPMIDAFEFTTNENGGGGAVDVEGLRTALAEYFSLDALDDPVLAPLLKEPRSSMVEMIREIGHNLRAIKRLKRDYAQAIGLQFCCGAYCIPLEYSQVAARLMHLYAPQDIQVAQMPQYGSRWVAKRFDLLPLTPEDWRRLIVYSWYEFDGMFFFQQMDVNGVHDLLRVCLDKSQSDQVNAIAFNVWTTARNRTTMRYGALATVDASLTPHDFLRHYAEQMGVRPVDQYVQAMDAIDAAIEKARDTWNIGFGWGWMWVGWWNTTLSNWRTDVLTDVLERWEQVRQDLAPLQATTPDGQWYLDFIRNRVDCSIYHYQAVLRLQPIVRMIVKGDNREPVDPATLTDQQRAAVVEACHDATYYTNKYMKTFAELMPERGSEGALMNYYYCLPQLILKLRSMYGGEPGAEPYPVTETDSWPAPTRLD